jgi:hypothetical protein
VDRSTRCILLAVEPGLLEGALAKLLSDTFEGEVVRLGRAGGEAPEGGYDAAVVSDELPEGVRADVLITLPDTRGSSGVGTVKRGELVDEVFIPGAERVLELLEEYVPPQAQHSS